MIDYWPKGKPQMRTSTSLAPVVAVLFVIASAANVFADDAQTYCNFTDGNQVTIQYHPTVKEEPRNGRVWSPGITLYVQTPLKLGGSEIPLGAYTIYLTPDRKNWTITVNKNVTAGTAYNSAQDVAHAPMEVGEIPEPTKQLQLSFAHMAPKQCSLRVYYQKTGAFVDFMEQ
ncbi:MAG: hypothetical protein AUG89_01460 [Acidobacteria bacterium 13_1_20CM_4_56_7]|jgi:hypothetical protein|nr:MAG: hypothetical protein AUG89_01460 [Acidobacteria bacterium 13_1_20CM_4_56_7]